MKSNKYEIAINSLKKYIGIAKCKFRHAKTKATQNKYKAIRDYLEQVLEDIEFEVEEAENEN